MMVFDDTILTFRGERFVKCDWTEFYPDAAEAIPGNMPSPRGKHVVMTCFVDADHAGCKETRRSHSGISIFVNRAPILWYSKRQNTVEASAYGSELLAMRLSIEMNEGLRYKLQMMGVPLIQLGPFQNAICAFGSETLAHIKTIRRQCALQFVRCSDIDFHEDAYRRQLARRISVV